MFRIITVIFLVILLIYLLRKSCKENFSNNNKLSVLILSYKRPHNLSKSIPQLLKFEEVDEIIVLHGSKEFKKDYNHPKVKNINDWNDNDKIYTLRKFKNSSLCKNDMVLLLDDDLYPSKDLLNNMIKDFNNDKNNIYGPTKRLCKEKYTVNPPNQYNYILTNIILTSKNVVQNVFNKMKSNNKLYKLVIKQRGNCEDLLFNHEFIKLYKKKPVFVNGSVKNLDSSNGFSTTKNNGHLDMRNNFCKLVNNM